MNGETNTSDNEGNSHNDGSESENSAIGQPRHSRKQETESKEDQHNPDQYVDYILEQIEFAFRWLRTHWPGNANHWTAWGTWLAVIAGIVYAAVAAGQLSEMRRQTRQSLESFRLDERAWVEIEPIKRPSDPLASFGAFRYELYPKNVGKTVARDIKIEVLQGGFLNSITMGDNADNVARLQDMLINGAMKGIPRTNPISKVLAPNTISTVPFIMDGQAPQIFPQDELVSYLIGRIDYTDAFNVQHWLKFCYFAVDRKGTLWNCKEGNDEDKNPENPPN